MLAQGPTYGLGRTPTPEERKALAISVDPNTGKDLPQGHGNATEGGVLFRTKGCAGCHGATLTGGRASTLIKADKPHTTPWDLGRVLPWRAPTAMIVWDFINRGMPLNREGTLTSNEVYTLTAFLLQEWCDPRGSDAQRKESAAGEDADARFIRRAAGVETRSSQGSRVTRTSPSSTVPSPCRSLEKVLDVSSRTFPQHPFELWRRPFADNQMRMTIWKSAVCLLLVAGLKTGTLVAQQGLPDSLAFTASDVPTRRQVMVSVERETRDRLDDTLAR